MLFALLFAAPPDPGAWTPVMAIGEQPDQAIVQTARLSALARAAYLNRKLDNDTQQLVDSVAAKLQTLEPRGLYDLLGEVGRKKDDAHYFMVVGRMHPRGDYLVDAWGTDPLPSFSWMTGELAVKPARKDRYLISTDVSLHLDLDAADLTGFWRGVADWLERTAGDKGAKHGLDAADRAVFASLDSAFPNLGTVVTRYIGAKDVVASSPSLWFYLHPTFDTQKFAEDYPALAAGFSGGGGAGGRMRGRMRLTAEEKLFAFARFDSTAGTRIAMRPDLIRIPDGAYRFASEIELDLAGLQIRITDLRLDLQIARREGAATIEYLFNHVPTIKVSGAIMELISVELIDALIPSQMETIIRDFYGTLATGDGGRGASWKVTLPADESGPIRVQTRFEMLDNGFVSFWLRAGSGMFNRSEDAKKDLRALTDAFLTAFDRDFDLFQAKLLP